MKTNKELAEETADYVFAVVKRGILLLQSKGHDVRGGERVWKQIEWRMTRQGEFIILYTVEFHYLLLMCVVFWKMWKKTTDFLL